MPVITGAPYYPPVTTMPVTTMPVYTSPQSYTTTTTTTTMPSTAYSSASCEWACKHAQHEKSGHSHTHSMQHMRALARRYTPAWLCDFPDWQSPKDLSLCTN